MPSYTKVTSPNIEKLFTYLRKSQWHNVSANFSGFVRKEFEGNMERLEEDAETYGNIKRMIEYSEMGRFSEAREKVIAAIKEYNDMLDKLEVLNLSKGPSRRHNEPAAHYEHERQDDVSSPGRRETYSPNRRNVTSPTNRDIRTPNQRISPRNQEYRSQSRQNELNERDPRTSHYQIERTSDEPPVEHFDSMRLKSPDKPHSYDHQRQPGRSDSPEASRSADRKNRPGSNRPDQRSAGMMTSVNQMASSKALWGREHGDKQTDIVGSSTYRRDFPTYSVDNPERKDKEMYRDNFGSLAERDLFRDRDNGQPYREDTSRKSGHLRHAETPDYDQRPSEVARKFREIYTYEWADAYDEICREFGSEKTVKHLLWIVTEASLIANEIADRQLHGLERHAYEVMTSPGEEHRGGHMPRQMGEAIPTSRNLLQQYRKQTAPLSIHYVKEECRDKISKILSETWGFQKSHLSDHSRVTAYIYKCAELVWLMCVQDPPIVLQYINRESEGARFNHEHYNAYTKPGNVYEFGVWPMLRHGRNGPVLSKGVAQAI